MDKYKDSDFDLKIGPQDSQFLSEWVELWRRADFKEKLDAVKKDIKTTEEEIK